jgi:hypothetical protein
MDIRMEYECLLRDVFECGRYGDPFGLANADVFDNNLHPEIGHRLRFGISAAIKKIRHDFDLEEGINSELEKLDKNIWKNTASQEDIIKAIERAREIFKQEKKSS